MSPTTSAFIFFIRANPGALYPLVLNEFQFGVLNRCEYKIETTRGIIFIKGNTKMWTDEELLEGLGPLVQKFFPKEVEQFAEFNKIAASAISEKKRFSAVFLDPFEVEKK